MPGRPRRQLAPASDRHQQDIPDSEDWVRPSSKQVITEAVAARALNAGESWLQTRGLSASGLHVVCGLELSIDSPPRVARLELTVTPPAGLDRSRLLALKGEVEQCIPESLVSRSGLRVTVTRARAVA